MLRHRRFSARPTTLVLLFLAASGGIARAQIGTAFTYQGQLQNAGAPQTGACDFRFKLYDAATNGTQIGSTQTLSNTTVTNGLFTVAIDFGASAFTGAPRWLETAVACPSGGSPTTLSPRQALKPAPAAIFASNVAAPLTLSDGGSATVGATNTGGGSGVYGVTQGATGFAGAAGVWGDSHSFFGVWGTSNTNAGVWGESQGADGVHGHTTVGSASGVAGFNTSSGSGVYGNSVSGAGVWGDSAGFDGIHGHTTTGSASGVAGFNDSNGAGAFGSSASGDGVYGTGATGVHGNSTFGWGVYGHSQAADGVHGDTPNANNSGVAGINTAGGFGVFGSSQTNIGVFGGAVQGVNSIGVVGLGGADSGAIIGGTGVKGAGGAGGQLGGWGVWGVSNGLAVYAEGDLIVTGDKNFVEPHPSDPTKEIRYVALEGREADTFFRGTAHLEGGTATIPVPEDFRMVTDADGLTVQLTPVGALVTLACQSRSLDEIVVLGSADVDFDYVVHGVRKASKNFQPIRPNTVFVPRRATDPEFTVGFPEESVRRLKATRILNDDGTVNLETAKRLGWDQRPGWNEPERALPDPK